MGQEIAIPDDKHEVDASRSGRRWMFRLTAAGMSILCFIAFLEVLALTKLVDYRLVFATPYGKAWESPRNRLDPELIHVHQSYDSFEGLISGDLAVWFGMDTGLRYPVAVQYDQHGFRNDTDMTSADMVVVGDSFVEAPIVLKEKITTSLLAKSLSMDVYNLGQYGYAPQQELIAFKRYGLAVNPKVVVWIIFEGNDLTHDVRRYERHAKNWDRFISQTHGFRKRSFSRNIYHLVARTIRPKRHDKRFGWERSGVLTGPGQLAGERMYFGYDATEISLEDKKAITIGLAVIDEAARICQERGIKLLVAFAPIKYRVYHDMCTFEPGSKASTWMPSSMTDIVASWARDSQIEFLDLTNALRAKAKSGQLVYFLDDGHWNANGHAAAAQAIERFLQENHWLSNIP